MFVDDWQKWMDEHHIKLRGDPRDSRPDEMQTDRRLSGAKVETETDGNGGPPGDSHI